MQDVFTADVSIADANIDMLQQLISELTADHQHPDSSLDDDVDPVDGALGAPVIPTNLQPNISEAEATVDTDDTGDDECDGATMKDTNGNMSADVMSNDEGDGSPSARNSSDEGGNDSALDDSDNNCDETASKECDFSECRIVSSTKQLLTTQLLSSHQCRYTVGACRYGQGTCQPHALSSLFMQQ